MWVTEVTEVTRELHRVAFCETRLKRARRSARFTIYFPHSCHFCGCCCSSPNKRKTQQTTHTHTMEHLNTHCVTNVPLQVGSINKKARSRRLQRKKKLLLSHPSALLSPPKPSPPRKDLAGPEVSLPAQDRKDNHEVARAWTVLQTQFTPADAKRYDIRQGLGNGTFGAVFLAYDKDLGKEVALKFIRTARPHNAMEVFQEANVMEAARNAAPAEARTHYVGFHRILQSKRQAGGKMPKYMAISMEYCNGGSLYDLLCSGPGGRRQALPVDRARCLAKQLLTALSVMHDYVGIVHRDIKPHNIMIHDGALKLGDFGSCAILDSDQGTENSTLYYVTRWYRPPELWCHCDDRVDGIYDCKVDVWSAACVIFEMLVGEVLLPCNNVMSFVELISLYLGMPAKGAVKQQSRAGRLSSMMCEALDVAAAGPRRPRMGLRSWFPGLPTDAADLLLAMLRVDPTKRPSAAECLAHPFFTHARKEPHKLTLVDMDQQEQQRSCGNPNRFESSLLSARSTTLKGPIVETPPEVIMEAASTTDAMNELEVRVIVGGQQVSEDCDVDNHDDQNNNNNINIIIQTLPPSSSLPTSLVQDPIVVTLPSSISSPRIDDGGETDTPDKSKNIQRRKTCDRKICAWQLKQTILTDYTLFMAMVYSDAEAK
jgi:serine/threonine protein kinase